ncbi:MAG: glycosyltransferase family 2 protein [Gemmatimonadaceae bacterium]|nr:glycosyltransferase family 2 protein [Gemmatimonadaceae bacterium]MCC6432440.1 glycosyltransferase family 2 protein [Gemmatimonadaceae bacterium]
MFRPVVVIPVFNHERYVPALVDILRGLSLPCILVDDGSEASCAATLDRVAAAHPAEVTLVRHRENQGKGGAVLSGIAEADRAGFTHAVQIDADGQHTVEDVPRLIALAEQYPDALVTGQPIFDDSVPRARLVLRYLTHIMVSVNTLTLSLRDAMCGFRVYPVGAMMALTRRVRMGRRMDFDIEVLVRLDWARVPIVLMPTRVRYPLDGISHFRLVADNVRITGMHTRLFLGMLPRAPRLLLRRNRTIRAAA